MKLNFDDTQNFSELQMSNTDTNNTIKIRCGAAYGGGCRIEMVILI